ncbi:MAG: glycine cleavage T C-terminal barrel domain-containing protein, partial [Hyphomicrobiaceae bacterium]
KTLELDGVACGVSRSGYTGEDGFEISVPAANAEMFARALLSHPEAEAIGLGARDSLRLEAGLCLYGHDLDEGTSPVEAGLVWALGKRRRTEGGFPGAERILAELKNGPPRKRVGILPEGKAPAREGVEVADDAGTVIGQVTSGGFGPTLEGPCSMAMIAAPHAAKGTRVGLQVRGKIIPGVVTSMPFVPHRYKRRAKT